MWRYLSAQVCGLILAAVISLGLLSIALAQEASADMARAGFSAILSGPVTAADLDGLRANNALKVVSGSLDVVPEGVYFGGKSAAVSRLLIFDSLDELVQTWGLQAAIVPGVSVSATANHRALLDEITAKTLGIRAGDTLQWTATNPSGKSRDYSATVLGTFMARSHLASTVHVVPNDSGLHDFVRDSRPLKYSSLYVRGTANSLQQVLSSRQGRMWSLVDRQTVMRRLDVPGGRPAWTVVVAVAAILLIVLSRASARSLLPAALIGCIPAGFLAGQEYLYGPGLPMFAWVALGLTAVGIVLLTSPATGSIAT